MNIAIFTDAFFPQINGVVTSIMSIAENMTDRGHSVVIVAPRYKLMEDFDNPKIKVKRIASLPAGFYDDFRWTSTFSYTSYKFLRDEKIDIVHIMTPFFVSYLGIKNARMLDIPVVGTFHTFISNPAYYEHLFEGSPLKVSEDVAWNYCNLYYNAVDYVTAPTQEAVDIIRDNGCSVAIEAISNGIDLGIFDNSRAKDFQEKYNLSNEVVLYVGRIAQEKNITMLIDAFLEVRRNRPSAQLLIVGDGPQREEYEGYVLDRAPKGSITFTGAISHDELVKSGVFGSVALFASASETETQGITILEAQANSIVCVGVNAGGVKDLIEDGVNGYLTEPGDQNAFRDRIEQILENKDKHKAMGDKAREMTEIHRMDRVIDRWEELYSWIIERKKQGFILKKDYLHFKNILGIIKEFQLDMDFFQSQL